MIYSPPPQQEEAPRQRFRWVENSVAACRQFLELIGSHTKTPITGHSLTNIFGPNSESAASCIAALARAIGTRVDGDRTSTLYKEWRRALDIIYGDLDSRDSSLAEIVKNYYRVPTASVLGEQLFALHTYFALVGRLIATELLAVSAGAPDDAPSSWGSLSDERFLERLQSLENGQLPGDIQVINLFEADLFSWWSEGANDNISLRRELRNLVSSLNKLAFPRTAFGPGKATDVLRDLYQSLVPRKLRKALGEFLTPHWLAEACLQNLSQVGAPLESGRILDPTCGTGTFLLPIISKRLRELKSRENVTPDDIQKVLDSVAGIDLNPVAVTACRVNIVLALGDLALNGPLTLPIWRADSIIVPELTKNESTLHGDQFLPQHNMLNTSLEEPFTIPLSIENSHKISQLREIIELFIQDIVPFEDNSEISNNSVSMATERFIDEYKQHFSETTMPIDLDYTFEDDIAVAKNLFRQIAVLAQHGRNGVWARLIENAYAPVFAGKFDIVVGNPPWISWKNLPESWRKQTEDIWRRCGMWEVIRQPGDTYTTPNGDIATLVYAISVSRYATAGGYVGLLVPRALANADPGGRLFRQFHLTPSSKDLEKFPDSFDIRFNPIHISDWSKINPFQPEATTSPIFLISKTDEPANFPIQGTKWEINGAIANQGNKTNWNTYRPFLNEIKGAYSPITPDDSASSLSFQDANAPAFIKSGLNSYKFGKGLDTRGANGVLMVSVRRIDRNQTSVRVENDPSKGRNSAAKKQASNVEVDLVYPLLRGADVTAWHAKPSEHIVVPHDPAELVRPLSPDELRRKYPKTYRWIKFNDTFMGSRKPPSKAWNLTVTGKDRYRIQGISTHMSKEFLVAVREIAQKPVAALVETMYDSELGIQIKPLIDHKLNFCAVDSREEGLYLVAMHNSTPMQDLLISFASAISISPNALSKLPIPKFDPNNEKMVELSNLSRSINPDGLLEVEDVETRVKELQPEMDRLVLEVINEFDGYEPQPQRVRTARIRNPRTAATPSDVPLF